MVPPPKLPCQTELETELVPLVAEIALTVLRNRPVDIECFLADYLDCRERGDVSSPCITFDPAVQSMVSRMRDAPENKLTSSPPESNAMSVAKNDKEIIQGSNPESVQTIFSRNSQLSRTIFKESQPNNGDQNVVKPPQDHGASTENPVEVILRQAETTGDTRKSTEPQPETTMQSRTSAVQSLVTTSHTRGSLAHPQDTPMQTRTSAVQSPTTTSHTRGSLAHPQDTPMQTRTSPAHQQGTPMQMRTSPVLQPGAALHTPNSDVNRPQTTVSTPNSMLEQAQTTKQTSSPTRDQLSTTKQTHHSNENITKTPSRMLKSTVQQPGTTLQAGKSTADQSTTTATIHRSNVKLPKTKSRILKSTMQPTETIQTQRSNINLPEKTMQLQGSAVPSSAVPSSESESQTSRSSGRRNVLRVQSEKVMLENTGAIGDCTGEDFLSRQYSTILGILLGDISIAEAPFYAAVIGWGLLAILVLFAHALCYLNNYI